MRWSARGAGGTPPHLKAAAVGDDRPAAAHEAVQTSGHINGLRPRLQQEVVRVAEQQVQPRRLRLQVSRQAVCGCCLPPAPSAKASQSGLEQVRAESTCSAVIPLSAALVPTATNEGVSTTERQCREAAELACRGSAAGRAGRERSTRGDGRGAHCFRVGCE